MRWVFYDEGLKSEDGAPAYKILRQAMDVSAQDLVSQAYKELMERQELKEEYGGVAAIAQKWGY